MSGGPALPAVPARFTVPADHPSLPGHFPGRPIVPGVLLLDAVLAAAAAEGVRGVPLRLLRAKFAAPVRPGETVEIGFARKEGAARLAFACRCRGVTVLSGEVECAPPTSRP